MEEESKQNDENNRKSIKIILLGESGVGKTNLINVVMDKQFEQNTLTSIHSSYLEGSIEYDNKKFEYSLWDTAGQEVYRSLNKIFIKGSKIVICVYAIDSNESFQQMEFWINYAQEILEKDQYILAILANKSDLFEDQAVPDEEGRQLSDKYKAKFYITSAISDVSGFKKFIKELIVDYICLIGPDQEKNLNYTLLEKKPEKEIKKKKCC